MAPNIPAEMSWITAPFWKKKVKEIVPGELLCLGRFNVPPWTSKVKLPVVLSVYGCTLGVTYVCNPANQTHFMFTSLGLDPSAVFFIGLSTFAIGAYVVLLSIPRASSYVRRLDAHNAADSLRRWEFALHNVSPIGKSENIQVVLPSEIYHVVSSGKLLVLTVHSPRQKKRTDWFSRTFLVCRYRLMCETMEEAAALKALFMTYIKKNAAKENTPPDNVDHAMEYTLRNDIMFCAGSIVLIWSLVVAIYLYFNIWTTWWTTFYKKLAARRKN
jgi:hypothetical protein